MKRFTKVRAGALQFVLFVGTVIAIFLMTFVLVSYSHSYFHKKTALTIDLIQEAQFGLLSSFTKSIPLNDSISAPSSINSEISVTVNREFWGFFEKRRTITKHGSVQFSKTAFIGATSKTERPALYLRDRQRPLIMAGNAKITGQALLPEQGARRGNISGNSYRHDRLIFGKVNKSQPILPELEIEKIEHIRKLSNYGPVNAAEPISLKPNAEFKNSFGLPTKIIMDRTIYLDRVTLIGNIMIAATDKIVVGATANLRDVILLAPEIVLENGVHGCFQAIASKRIEVGNKVELEYPSALLVLEDSKNTIKENPANDNGIIVGTNALIKGMVVYVNGSERPSYMPQIKIASGSLVQGEIYCNGNLELKGTVHGGIITDAFISLENGSIYQNHLYDGIINSSLLQPEYLGLTMEDAQHKGVMKWLY